MSLAAPVLPFVFLIVLTWATARGYVSPQKRVLETAAIVVLAVAVVAALLRFTWRRELFFLWMSAFVSAFLARELKVIRTSSVYVLFLVLLALAWRHRETLRPYFERVGVLSALVVALVAYYISVQIDGKEWVRWMPGTKKTVWSPVEETMEVLGHLALLLAVLLATRPARHPASGDVDEARDGE